MNVQYRAWGLRMPLDGHASAGWSTPHGVLGRILEQRNTSEASSTPSTPVPPEREELARNTLAFLLARKAMRLKQRRDQSAARD